MSLFTEAEIIYSYTRKQAVEDGEQVLLDTKLTREAGYKYPVYVTRSVWNLVEMAVSNKKHCNDLEGVLWDILYMSIRNHTRRIETNTYQFLVIITGTGRIKNHNMLVSCDPADIDDPAPAITIMMPEEN